MKLPMVVSIACTYQKRDTSAQFYFSYPFVRCLHFLFFFYFCNERRKYLEIILTRRALLFFRKNYDLIFHMVRLIPMATWVI